MKLRKKIAAISLLTILVTTIVDLHALSHLFDSHMLCSVADCDECQDYMAFCEWHFDVASFNSYEVLEQISYRTTIISNLHLEISQKHLGKHLNKPPPFLI